MTERQPLQPVTDEILVVKFPSPQGDGADSSSEADSECLACALVNTPALVSQVSQVPPSRLPPVPAVVDHYELDPTANHQAIHKEIARVLVQRTVDHNKAKQEMYDHEASTFSQETDIESNYNIEAFCQTVSKVNDLRGLSWIRRCYVVEHRLQPHPILQALGPFRHISPVARLRSGLSVPLLVLQCKAAGCKRCVSGKGGFIFQWAGPWTCSNARGSDNGPAVRMSWHDRLRTCGCEGCRNSCPGAGTVPEPAAAA